MTIADGIPCCEAARCNSLRGAPRGPSSARLGVRRSAGNPRCWGSQALRRARSRSSVRLRQRLLSPPPIARDMTLSPIGRVTKRTIAALARRCYTANAVTMENPLKPRLSCAGLLLERPPEALADQAQRQLQATGRQGTVRRRSVEIAGARLPTLPLDLLGHDSSVMGLITVG